MNKHFIVHLRRFSFVPGKERTWISKLGDDQLYQLFLKIRNGESARAIASYVLTAWKVGQKASVHSTSQAILKFKERISHLLLSPPSATDKANAPGFPPMCDEDSPLERMEYLAEEYELRIKKMISEEKETGMKYPFLNRDLQALATLRKAILKQKEWEATHEDPLKRERRKRMEQNMGRKFDALMQNFDENGRDRLIKAAERMLELAEERSLIMYKKEDGTYAPVSPEEEPNESNWR